MYEDVVDMQACKEVAYSVDQAKMLAHLHISTK